MNRCPTIRYPYAASAVRNATPTSTSTRTSIEPVSPLSMRSDTVPNANCGAIWPSVISDTSTIPATISHLNRRTTSHPPTGVVGDGGVVGHRRPFGGDVDRLQVVAGHARKGRLG